jgi:hypothetical protein
VLKLPAAAVEAPRSTARVQTQKLRLPPSQRAVAKACGAFELGVYVHARRTSNVVATVGLLPGFSVVHPPALLSRRAVP